MSLKFKRTLVSMACLGLLVGCGVDEDEEDTSSSTYVLYAMSEVVSGYQTFQQRDLDYDDIDVDEDASTYIYKDRENDDSSDVTFYIANSSATDSEELVVSAATDINDTYTIFHIDDATVKVEGVNTSGDYVFVQDKESGDLYTVINGADEPIDSSNIDDDMYWMDSYRYSNIADEERIYLNDSDAKILYIYEFDGDYFAYEGTFDYSGNDFWIDDQGDILMQSASNSYNMYYYEQGEYDDPLSKTVSYLFYPFLYDGDFQAVRSGNSNVYDLVTQTSTFYFDYDSSWSNDDDLMPTVDGARRDSYEMTSDCQLFQYNDDNPYAISIDLIEDFEDQGVEDGFFAIAGQDALFCAYEDGDASAILKYDLDSEEVTTYTLDDDTLADVTDYFTVISDNEVMFSDAPTGSFNEYYIDLENEEDETIDVSESSIVLLQRLTD